MYNVYLFIFSQILILKKQILDSLHIEKCIDFIMVFLVINFQNSRLVSVFTHGTSKDRCDILIKYFLKFCIFLSFYLILQMTKTTKCT